MALDVNAEMRSSVFVVIEIKWHHSIKRDSNYDRFDPFLTRSVSPLMIIELLLGI